MRVPGVSLGRALASGQLALGEASPTLAWRGGFGTPALEAMPKQKRVLPEYVLTASWPNVCDGQAVRVAARAGWVLPLGLVAWFK